MEFNACVALELDIFDQECPDIVAKSVCFEVALQKSDEKVTRQRSGEAHFKRQAALHLLGKRLCNHPIEVCEDPQCELRLDTAIVDQVVNSINETLADANSYMSIITFS